MFKQNWKASNCPKKGPHRGCFPRNFLKFAEQSFRYMWAAASAISLYLRINLCIFPTHFHLNHSKSYRCSHLYNKIWIYYIYCFYFVSHADLKWCRLIMQTWYNTDWYNFLIIAWLKTRSSQLTDRFNCSSQLANNHSQSSQLKKCWVCISQTRSLLIIF